MDSSNLKAEHDSNNVQQQQKLGCWSAVVVVLVIIKSVMTNTEPLQLLLITSKTTSKKCVYGYEGKTLFALDFLRTKRIAGNDVLSGPITALTAASPRRKVTTFGRRTSGRCGGRKEGPQGREGSVTPSCCINVRP